MKTKFCARVAFAAVGIGIAVATFFAGTKVAISRLYPAYTVVTEVNYETDEVFCEDFVGNVWSFYGTEDWIEGDIASLLMDTMGTEETIYDDEIVRARYTGWVY